MAGRATGRTGSTTAATRVVGSVRAGLLTGVGLAGTLDEVILHQLLHWHHLYDRSTRTIGLVSDGLFHIASTVLLVMGVWGARRLVGAGPRAWRQYWGALLAGLGGFNLYDATVQHKILRLHQVRPAAANWLPYDLAFGGVAVVLLVAGLLLLRSSRDGG